MASHDGRAPSHILGRKSFGEAVVVAFVVALANYGVHAHMHVGHNR